MMTATTKESGVSKSKAQILLERYWEEASNQGDYELIREICADPIIRHDPEGKTTKLSHEEQIARVKMVREDFGGHIERIITHSDDTYVTSVWEITSDKDEAVNLCGIEVFKVEDGKLAHCWNTPYGNGKWG
jgi:hypothetical protein